MKGAAGELRRALREAGPRLRAIGDAASRRRPARGAWSPREILGHLVDSAANNHRRFVLAQLQDDLVFPGYDGDAWVSLQRYRDIPWLELIQLWEAYNAHLARLMAGVPVREQERPRRRHNLHQIAWKPVSAEKPATLGYFMRDYVGHLAHHLGQILTLSARTRR